MTATPDIQEVVAHLATHGYARLGQLADAATVATLAARADAMMLGEVTYDGLFFQLDAESGRYEDLPYGEGYRGPSLAYRKIEKLEKDPLFLTWIAHPTFRSIAGHVYAGALDDATRGVALYRAMLMNKHAGGGSDLPWHQDGGAFWGIDREPRLQVWTALDDAPHDGGCLEVVPGSHHAGLATPNGGVVPAAFVAQANADARAVTLPAEAGEVILLHNHVWHRSARSRSGKARRAISVCYMDGATRCRRRKHAPRSFFTVWPGTS